MTARIFRQARIAGLPFLSHPYSEANIAEYLQKEILPTGVTTVAILDDRTVGYCVVAGDWLEQLYIMPEAWSKGVGTALLDQALAGNDYIQLWVFQKNLRARKFYERRGFVMVELTHGANNMEHEPDARYELRAAGN